jgi:type I restriction enzyme S subunit
MIDGLRPYPATKASGVDWLPALPEGWEIHRAKYSFREADDRSAAGDEELLSVSHKTGVTPRSQKNITMFMAESYEGHKVCRPGDVVVNTMWAWMAAIGVSRHIGIVSPAYGVYRPRTADRFEPKFLDYLLRTEVYRAEYLRSSRGVTTSRLRLYPPDFLSIPFVQPPLDEQLLIVRFLDWHGGQTAKLIRAKKKIITLLNEQKQAIVHRAVTRGVDPNAKLKPSDIPWLGDVPAHWDTRRNGRLFGARRETGFPDLPVLEVSIKNGVRIRDFGNGTRKQEMSDRSKYQRALQGDIAYNMMRMWQGAVGVVPSDGLVSPAYVVARPFPDAHAVYYTYLFRTAAYMREIDVFSRGIVPDRNRLYWESFKQIASPYPPPSEQEEISRVLDLEVSGAIEAISVIDRGIALIQEFRTRLIADVVIGKLDVRAAAANLPEPTEPEASESFSDDPPEDDELDEAIDDAENEEVAA